MVVFAWLMLGPLLLHHLCDIFKASCIRPDITPKSLPMISISDSPGL